jgi:hypothetical protein
VIVELKNIPKIPLSPSAFIPDSNPPNTRFKPPEYK